MKFGTRVADRKPGTGSAGGGSGDFIRYFTKGEKRLRYLDEMADWTEYYEHFSQSKRRSYPCTGDFKSCPGCQSENEMEASASRKHLTNALDPERGYVNLWKVPASVIEDFSRYSDKADGTILDRDYTVIQFKNSEGKVSYSLDREEKDRIDLGPYLAKKKDHQQALAEAYIEVWGALPDGSTTAPAPEVPTVESVRAKLDEAQAKHNEKISAARYEREIINADAEKPTMETMVDKVYGGAAESEPPSEPAGAAEPEQAEEGEQEISEDELRKMSPERIKALFAQCGLPVPDSEDSDTLADALIEALG